MTVQNKKAIITEKLKRLYLSINPYVISKSTKQLARKGFKESIRVYKKRTETIEDYPIDFVITWVDGSDPTWQKEKAKYQSNDELSLQNNCPSRYRDWDNLQYWFRAVEKNAPWVRNIFFVTCGHVPSWLDTSNPKLRIIKHSDYIPKEYLPTFNSVVIENNLWRIHELSEHFVLFNDDMFINNPIEKTDTFIDGMPLLVSVAKPNKPKLEMTEWDYARFNNCRACNSHYNIRSVMEQHPEKWFSFLYGSRIKYNIRTYEDGFIPGMVFPHVYYSFRKTSMRDCYYQLEHFFESTNIHRFRSNDDLNPQIFNMWEMMHNTFKPVNSLGVLLNVTEKDRDSLKAILRDPSIKCICINDSERIDEHNFEGIKAYVNELLSRKYSDKSSYEKEVK